MNYYLKLTLPCCLMGLINAAQVNAAPVTVEGNRTDNRAYIALNWQFGSAPGLPNLVLGARHVKVKSNDHLSNGADLSVQFTTAGGLSLDRVRLTAIGGNLDGFYGVGAGYNFKTSTPLLTGTVGAPHIRLIGDYSIGNGIDGLIQLETLSKPKPITKVIPI